MHNTAFTASNTLKVLKLHGSSFRTNDITLKRERHTKELVVFQRDCHQFAFDHQIHHLESDVKKMTLESSDIFLIL